MPVQRTICGQPVSLRMPPRRFQVFFIILFSLVATLFVFGAPSSDDLPSYEEVADVVKNPRLPTMDDLPGLPNMPSLKDLPDLPDLPKVPNPFGPAAHKPPAQGNSNSTSQYGTIMWMFNYKWRDAFSAKITFDENTAVLPPSKQRPAIYSFYEPDTKQDKAVIEAENRLVLAWRRAWWAQGFKPQVLSRGEAMAHPQYQLVQRLKLGEIDPAVDTEVMRWLAWGHMGGGILTDWLALPMAEYENPILRFLRKGDYPALSYIDSLENGVFYGQKLEVEAGIKKALESQLFKNTTASHDKIVKLKLGGGAIINLIEEADWNIVPKSHGIAYYSKNTVEDRYSSIADKLNNRTDVEGLDLLANLINSHLHLTFQNTYPEGIAVVQPLPEHTTALMYEAIDIARNLTQCPTSPIPKSCPPNKKNCSPCDPAKPKKLQLVPSMKNSSALYSIGTTPHPYSLASLHYQRDTLDANFLRNDAGRDLWLASATKEILGDLKSAAERVVFFKEVVASPDTISNSLWLTAERVSHVDLDWIFGFNLPQLASSNEDSSSPDEKSELVIFPRPEEPTPIEGVEVLADHWVMKEEKRLKKARNALKSKDKLWKKVVAAVEQWNLADTEAWRFVRAFSARGRQERIKWEEEEKKYAGSEKKSGVRPGGEGSRWTDRL